MSGALKHDRSSIYYFFYQRKLWKNVDKTYKSGAFCSGTHNSSTIFSPSVCGVVGGKKKSSLSIEIACIRKYINWWARENPLEIQFYYSRLAFARFLFPMQRAGVMRKFRLFKIALIIQVRSSSKYLNSPYSFFRIWMAKIEFIDFSTTWNCDFATVIINIIMHFNQNLIFLLLTLKLSMIINHWWMKQSFFPARDEKKNIRGEMAKAQKREKLLLKLNKTWWIDTDC